MSNNVHGQIRKLANRRNISKQLQWISLDRQTA